MPTLLHLDSSPLESSISRELGREFVKTWKAANRGGQVIYRDLAAEPPAVLDQNWIYASFMPEASRTPEQAAVLTTSDTLIAELEQADEYVIGAAMHNFGISGALKLWVDQVLRNGETFAYGAQGPQGLLKGKKATVLIASGGVYEEGTPAWALNFVEPYLKTILGFIGVTDVTFVTAGGAAKIMSGAIDREGFLAPNLEKVRSLFAAV